MSSHELYAKMEQFWGEFSENHSKFTEKGNKAAATRARKAVDWPNSFKATKLGALSPTFKLVITVYFFV